MSIIKANATQFFALPEEIRENIYRACDDKTRCRLEQTCKQVNAAINPFVWKSLTKRYSPGFQLQNPRNAKLCYRVAVSDHNKLALGDIMTIAHRVGAFTRDDHHGIWIKLQSVIGNTKVRAHVDGRAFYAGWNGELLDLNNLDLESGEQIFEFENPIFNDAASIVSGDVPTVFRGDERENFNAADTSDRPSNVFDASVVTSWLDGFR